MRFELVNIANCIGCFVFHECVSMLRSVQRKLRFLLISRAIVSVNTQVRNILKRVLQRWLSLRQLVILNHSYHRVS